MAQIKLLGISGALRKESTNTMLLHEAARLMDGAELTLGDLNFPLYDADLEAAEGVPEAVKKLAAQIGDADAVIISTPEYNRGITGVLKNALDWVSRVEGNPWNGKPVALMSAAAGRAGGDRGQLMLHACMTPFNPMIVHGAEIAVAASFNEFDDAGRLKGELYVENLSALMDALRAAV
ncbi:NADPH-dependent FMN reductase [Lentibacter sp. XHP0401]|jgi:chromate reductase, NAD(P)H dehydrogenase (quinone)|uniref:NADPH-dependent FMN reductase n=1 Tax=Lentibacter sp. XHP0401 TaxID=2984334 RepID=UPI0021E83138|nr:NAD(P)H-dependent oxidoreductase [Lentibacter sp. XHP0401]MCV2892686.1 NAD(P)H-dependent oxidoreductase [Lentibacter sp. XHP0401]